MTSSLLAKAQNPKLDEHPQHNSHGFAGMTKGEVQASAKHERFIEWLAPIKSALP